MASNNNGLLIVGLLAAGYLWWTSREPAAPANETNTSGQTGTIIDFGGVPPKNRAYSTDPGDTNTVIDTYTPELQW